MKHRTEFRILGMTCTSCEVRIERTWKKLNGIEHVSVNHAKGKAVVTSEGEPDVQALQAALEKEGYRVTRWEEISTTHAGTQHDPLDYLIVGTLLMVLFILYMIFRELKWIPDSFGVQSTMSYPFIFFLGIIAAFSSCAAVTGGLLLAVVESWRERNPEYSGWRLMKPQIYFNLGRVFFYGVLGGAVGALGSVFSLSSRSNGVLMIGAGVVMLILAFQLLHLFPSLSRFLPKMPKGLAHRIHDYQGHEHPLAPFLLGGATFFLPCGFTQALQLYVLGRGDWKIGATAMLLFSLGTLPALLSISAISSYTHGAFRRYFGIFAGMLLVVVAFWNIKSGLTLSGVNLSFKATVTSQGIGNSLAEQVDGKQIVRMKVDGLSYTPSRFTVKKGIPVEWQIDGRSAGGCARFIVVPQLGIQKLFSTDQIDTITFTPQEVGKIYFSCPMGMTTYGSSFDVVD